MTEAVAVAVAACRDAADDDDDIDLSVLDDNTDDCRLKPRKPVHDDDALGFEQFLIKNRARNAEKARIKAMLERSCQNQLVASGELERIRSEIERDQLEESRAQAFDIDHDSESIWVCPETPLPRPTLHISELNQLLLVNPASSESLCDQLMQPVEHNTFCRRFRGQRSAAADLATFLWHVAATNPDPFVTHRAGVLLLATLSDSNREPSTLVTLDPIDLPLSTDRRRDPICIRPAQFVDAFLSYGSRKVMESVPVPSMSGAPPNLPPNIATLLTLLAGCIDIDLGQYGAQALAILPYLAAFLIDPHSMEFVNRVQHCLFRLMNAASHADGITVSSVVKVLLDDRICTRLSNKYRILSALPHSKFGTAVAKQGALQVTCAQLDIIEDAAKAQNLTILERLVAVVEKAAIHSQCDDDSIQRDLAILIRLQHLIVFRRQPLTRREDTLVSNAEKEALQSIINSWGRIKDSLPTALNAFISTAQDALIIGLRIAEHIVDRSVQTGL